ncbi:permease [Clostridium sp.]|uniref:permease n=1 Tax=Clostridium sp. TaxID=1506 RepID=UPI002FCC6F34
MINFIKDILFSVWSFLVADWYILLIGIILAISVSVYVDTENLRKMLMKKSGISVPGAVIFGSLTPLCACGTMAVLFAMFASAMPWGPVMAFLISSPLTSPSEYMFETAFFGSKFATAMLISSIVLGLFAGFLANFLEKKTNFFKNQFRMISDKSKSCCSENTNVNEHNCCTSDIEVPTSESCCCEKISNKKTMGFLQKYKLDKLLKEFVNIGLKKILLYFVIFIAIGRVVEMIIPQSLIMTLFSADKAYSIPLAATIGLPLYLNDSSALPLLKSLINSGAGEGVVLAFMITGKATGIPVIAGMSTFLKKRAMLFYIGIIYVGGILAGYIFQLVAR